MWSDTPDSLNSFCQKLLVNIGSLSEIIEAGNPCNMYTVLKMSLPQSQMYKDEREV
jgi:hypothetical protein